MTTYREFTRTADLDLPSSRWVFLDENVDKLGTDSDKFFRTINDGLFAVLMGNSGKPFNDFPTASHGNAGGMAFADGHSEIHKWTSAAVTGPLCVPGVNAGADYDFLAANTTALK